ncbi:chromosome partitioning protein [Acidiphilium sp. MT5]
MARIIAVAQQKGGAGKSMVVAQLAVWFGMERRVACIDIDPQGTLAAWGLLRAQQARARADVSVQSVTGWRLSRALDQFRASHEIVLIDTPPVLDGDQARAIREADLVLVPLNPAPPDLWAAEATLKRAAEERRRVALVFNRAPAASRLRRRLEVEIAARGLALLPALGNRMAFAMSFAEGLGVAEATKPGLAGEECAALGAALRDL